MTRNTSLLIAASILLWPSASMAQATATPAPALPIATPHPEDTIRLSDRARDAILDSNTVESAAAARGERLRSGVLGLGIHGEIGATIGTGGARSLYGIAAIPLGDHAGAVVSFESTRFGGYRRR